MSSRIQVLAEDGSVENVIIADEAFAEALYPGRWKLAPSESGAESLPGDSATAEGGENG